MPRLPSIPSKSAGTTPKKSSKASLTAQLLEMPVDVLVDLIERHAKTVPALKQEMMRLLGNDKAVITEIKRGIKKLSAVKPNTRSRPKEIREQLMSVLELIKHVGIRRPSEAFSLMCLMLDEASNVAASFSAASVVATFFRETLPAAGAAVIGRCLDQILVRDELQVLCLSDRYGTKALFLEGIGDALPDDVVDALRKHLAGRIKPKKYEWMTTNDDIIGLMKALEVAVGNTEGFEKAARLEGPMSFPDVLVLARMCLDHERYDDANAWLGKIRNGDDLPFFRTLRKQRDDMYVRVAQASGSTAHAEKVFNTRLLNAPTADVIKRLKELVGAAKTQHVLQAAATSLVAKKHVEPQVILFYVDHGFDAMMEQRMHTSMQSTREELDRYFALAEGFQSKHRTIGCILTYRMFITAVLDNAAVEHYESARHALRRQLDLCRSVKDLQGLDSSSMFEDRIRTTYASKKAFWRNIDSSRRYGYY